MWFPTVNQITCIEYMWRQVGTSFGASNEFHTTTGVVTIDRHENRETWAYKSYDKKI